MKNSFNEDHILAVSQAICDYRASNKITGPLFMGMDTHGLSEGALATAIEVFAAAGVTVMIQKDFGYTPTPVISHAILRYNRRKKEHPADGVVITPSHNPPPAGSNTTRLTADPQAPRRHAPFRTGPMRFSGTTSRM